MKHTTSFFSKLRHLPLKDKINFARHLSIMSKAGLPLLESLGILRRQAKGRGVKMMMDDLITAIDNGQSLAEALKKYRSVFGDFFISVIEVGDASGTLSDNLAYLAEELHKAKLLREKIRSAMIYPIILLVATVAVSGFLTFVVFPKIIKVFTSLNTKLPITTQVLINVLGFLRAHGIWVVLALVALTIATRLLMKLPAVKTLYDRAMFLVPVISRVTVSVNMSNFARIFGVLLKSGVHIVEALVIVSRTFDNLVYRKAFEGAADELRRGGTLAQYLNKRRNIFPPFVSAMVEVGESTGNLESNLFYITEYYTEDVDSSIKTLTSVLEPALILIMGLVVGFVALSIITPIYSITQSVSK